LINQRIENGKRLVDLNNLNSLPQFAPPANATDPGKANIAYLFRKGKPSPRSAIITEERGSLPHLRFAATPLGGVASRRR
jgi:hypothetical protein